MDNLPSLLSRPVSEPLDPHSVSQVLSHPPFLHIPSLINARDLNDGSLSTFRQGYAFRSGSLEQITEEGKAQLQALGVKTIIDLRSVEEVAAFPDPEIEGMEVRAVNVGREWSRNEGVGVGKGERSGNELPHLYLKMLETNAFTFRALLLHVRDKPDEPFLFHCTAGKDRTGVAAAVLLALVGASKEYIARDFALTRIGFEPARQLLTMKLTGGKPVDENNREQRRKMDLYGDSSVEVMTDFLEIVEEKYGSVEGCVKKLFEFGDENVEVIKKNLMGF